MAGLHYVYLHRKATDGTVFYVGKGKDRRAWGASGRSPHWHNIKRKHGYSVEILKTGLGEYCALTLERILIDRIGLANLANATLGGGGIQGWRHSEETKRRIGEAAKGHKPNANQLAALDSRGRKTSDETRRKQSARKAGKSTGPRSAETRAKIAASHIGIRPSPETLRKLSLAKIGKACGRDSPSYDHTERDFYHHVYGKFNGTRGDLIAKYNLGAGCMAALLKGNRKSVKGWRVK